MLVRNIVDKMTDDKIGLIVYAGGAAYTQLLITVITCRPRCFLETINPSMITTQGTDIKQAIDLAMKKFYAQSGREQGYFCDYRWRGQ